MVWTNLHTFYASDIWTRFKQQLMLERTNILGQIICEYCGNPIIHGYDCIGHHEIPLTLDNVNDYDISLSSSNVQLVHMRCHNSLHMRWGTYERKVYLVHGAPCSGKSTFVSENAEPDDLIVDMDSIWGCISNGYRYVKSDALKANAFGVRDCLLDQVRTRLGKWRNAWIIGSYPLLMERERMVRAYGCELIHIDTGRDECLTRCSDRPVQWAEYVREYFERVQIPPG